MVFMPPLSGQWTRLFLQKSIEIFFQVLSSGDDPAGAGKAFSFSVRMQDLNKIQDKF